MRGRTAGSCDQSASIWMTMLAPPASATPNPSRYARPRPCLPGRWRTRMRGSAAASSSAIRPVPSGELSSTTRSTPSGSCSRIAAAIGVRFSASLYVGSTTQERPRRRVLWCRDARKLAGQRLGHRQTRVRMVGATGGRRRRPSGGYLTTSVAVVVFVPPWVSTPLNLSVIVPALPVSRGAASRDRCWSRPWSCRTSAPRARGAPSSSSRWP